MVELCKSRVNILHMDEELILKEAQDMSFEKIRQAIRQVSCPPLMSCRVASSQVTSRHQLSSQTSYITLRPSDCGRYSLRPSLQTGKVAILSHQQVGRLLSAQAISQIRLPSANIHLHSNCAPCCTTHINTSHVISVESFQDIQDML